MNFHGWVNAVEAVFWVIVGMTVWSRSRRLSSGAPLVANVAAAVLLVFGATDVIEIFTGAWYRPVALLVLKGACLATLVGCYVWYRRVR